MKTRLVKRGMSTALLHRDGPHMGEQQHRCGTRLISQAVINGLRTGQSGPGGGLTAGQSTELRETLTRVANDVGMSSIELTTALERAIG